MVWPLLNPAEFCGEVSHFAFFVRQFIFMNTYVGWGWEMFSVVFIIKWQV
jgi:hypothetical protein